MLDYSSLFFGELEELVSDTHRGRRAELERCALGDLCLLAIGAKLPFGGTTILIIAGVGLDTLRQAKAQTEQFQYTGFLFENVDHKEG